jgi:hypothetical protein
MSEKGARRNKEVRQRRDGPAPSFGGEIGVKWAEEARRVCDERGFRHADLLLEIIPPAVYRHDAKKRANTSGGLIFSGFVQYAIVVNGPHGKQIIGIVDDAEIAEQIVLHVNRTASVRWRQVERIKQWKTNSIQNAKILPAAMREATLAQIETTFATLMAEVDKELPPHGVTEASMVEVPEILSVPDVPPIKDED